MSNSNTTLERQRRILIEALSAAVTRSQAGDAIVRELPPVPTDGRLILLAAGKASPRMVEVAEAHYASSPGRQRISGLAVTAADVERPFRFVDLQVASHPLPDERSEAAARRMLATVDGLSENDQVVMLLSGGASALLCAPAAGITLAEKRATTEALFDAGAPIDDINTVRKFISAIKGGKLAQACWPAKLRTLTVSDVVGDDPEVIGSAPTYPCNVTADQVRAIVARYTLELPRPVIEFIDNAPSSPVDARLPKTDYVIIARPRDALQAAADCAKSHGYDVEVLGDDIKGEASREAESLAQEIHAAENGNHKLALLSGGEVTVSFTPESRDGYGGPNREFALALANALERDKVSAIIADTDGLDGQTGANGPVAGALVDSTTISRARAAGLDPEDYLQRHDAGSFFELLGDEIVTGLTATNVNDFRMVLIN